MKPLARLRLLAREYASRGMTSDEITDRLALEAWSDIDVARLVVRAWCFSEATDAAVNHVKPAGVSPRAPAPEHADQLPLGLTVMPALTGYNRMERYWKITLPRVNRWKLYDGILAVIRPFVALHDPSEYATFGDLLRAAGVSDADVAALAA